MPIIPRSPRTRRSPGERALPAVAAASLALAACGGTGGSRSPGAAADGAAPPACEGPGYAEETPSLAFASLSATVVDGEGAAVPGVTAQACGVNVCLNGKTGNDGAVLIQQEANMQRPAFKYGGGQRFAKFALPLAGAEPLELSLGEQRTFAFDPPEQGAPLEAGRTATSRGVSITLAGNSAPVEPDPFDFDTPELQRFRAVEIPAELAPAAVDASLGFGALVALTPVGAELCPPARLSVPNTAGYPAGAAVEVFVHGVEVAEQWAPYGGWAKVSSGRVTDDGASIETSEGGGLPVLSVVGVRLAP